jgi:hypothetical protein
MKSTAFDAEPIKISNLLLLAVWLGVVVGIIEGGLLYLFQALQWNTWRRLTQEVDANILWVSPASDVLFLVLAAIVVLPLLFVYRKRGSALTISLLGATGAFAILAVPDRLRFRGVLLLSIGLGAVFARWFGRAPQQRFRLIRSSLPYLLAFFILIGVGVRLSEPILEARSVQSLPIARSNSPNILLIVLDTVRADRLSAYGYGRPTTPFLETLAKKGVLFEKAFASSSWTLPSHATLFTGLHPFRHGAQLWPLHGHATTLAEVLTNAGYETGAVVANRHICNSAFGLNQGFTFWENSFVSVSDGIVRTSLGNQLLRLYEQYFQDVAELKQTPAGEVTQRFLHWTRKKRDRPVFGFVNYMAAHSPVEPLPEFANRYAQDPEKILASRWFQRLRDSVHGSQPQQLVDDAYDA